MTKVADVQKLEVANDNFHTAEGYYRADNRFAVNKEGLMTIVAVNTKKHYRYSNRENLVGLHKRVWIPCAKEDTPFK